MMTESIETYHANSAISHSKLETYRRRPQLYYRRHIAKTVPAPEPTAAFRLGSAAHCAILECDEFAKRYVEKLDVDRRTKEGKELYAKFLVEHDGKTVIDREELDVVDAMSNAVSQNKLAQQLLAAGQPELTWRQPQKNVLGSLQCRTDWFNAAGCELTEGRPYMVDLKTVESLDADAFRNFERAIFNYGYHRQAGFYLPLITEIIGKPVFDCYFIAVEKVEPFGVGIYRLADDVVAQGQDETIVDLIRLKDSIESSTWPNITPDVQHVSLPGWYKKENT